MVKISFMFMFRREKGRGGCILFIIAKLFVAVIEVLSGFIIYVLCVQCSLVLHFEMSTFCEIKLSSTFRKEVFFLLKKKNTYPNLIR